MTTTTLTQIDRQGFHAPLVAYYGSLIDEVLASRDNYPYVSTLHEAEQIIPTLVRTTPVVKILSGEFQGDYIVMVPIPWVLPQSFGDDEYTFECE